MALFHNLPSLIEVNNEHDVISEAGQTVCGGHNDNECKYIVNERVECLQTENENYKLNYG